MDSRAVAPGKRLGTVLVELGHTNQKTITEFATPAAPASTWW